MSINRYYEQLLEDISNAAIRKPTEVILPRFIWEDKEERNPGFEFLEGKKFSEWFGLNPEIFPPADRLSEEQLTALADSLAKLYHHFNHELAISKYESPLIRYTLAVETLEKVESFSMDVIEPVFFCDKDVKKCPFKNDCYCDRNSKENPCSF